MSDWSVLNRPDPAPGDVAATRQLGQSLLQQASGIETQTTRLKGLASGAGDLQMAGDYAAGFTQTLTDLPPDLTKLSTAYRGCGQALVTFADALQQAKIKASTALSNGEDANLRYTRAITDLRSLLPAAQQGLVGGGQSINLTSIQAATASLDAGMQQQIQVTARRAQTADADLDAAQALADQAASLRDDAESACAEGIRHALSDSGIKNKAWYQKAWDFVSAPFRSWDAFIDLCGKAAMVAGLLALVISGPIGAALLAVAFLAGAAIFADGLMKYSAGEIGLGELGLDALGAIPGGGEFGAGARALEEANDVRLGLNGAKDLVGGAKDVDGLVTAGARDMDNPGIRTAVEDGPKATKPNDARIGCGDPIDVVSGEMYMSMTDVDLPGALPLVLERSYVSSYGVGRHFGPSWSSFLDQRLEIDSQGVCFAYTEGVLLTYPHVAAGESVMPETGPRLSLSRREDGHYFVTDHSVGRMMWFAPPPDDARSGERPVVLPLAAVSDRNGHRIDLGYGAADGALTELRHTGGYVVDVETENGRIIALRLGSADGAPLLMRYRYDAAGRLIEVINPAGQPLQFAYDRQDRIISWTDRNGTWYRYTYDEAGRVVRTSGSGRCLTGELEYDTTNQVTIETNSLGARYAYHYNDLGQVTRIVDPLGHTTVYEWDRYDRKLSETDALGRVTRYAYDEDDNLAEVTDPDGLRTRVDFNDLHQPTRVVQRDGTVWQHSYDSRGNLTAVTDPLGAVTRYAYDERGGQRAIVDALGHRTAITTDAAGLALSITDPHGATTTIERNAFGRSSVVTDPLGQATRYDWTVDGRLASRTLPGGVSEQWRYDGEGNLVEYIDAQGGSTTIQTTFFDLPGVRTDPLGGRLVFTYDTELKLTSVTDPRGLVWQYEYDAAGRMIRETDYDGRVLSYRWDNADQLIERVNGAGQAIAFTHDAMGNVVGRHSAEGPISLNYDAMGRLIRATNPDADVEFERNARGQVLAETTNGRTLASFYDAAGRRVARRTPSGAESRWEYDATGRPLTLTSAGHITRFAYDVAGREIERALGTGAVLRQSWSASRQLLTQSVVAPFAATAARSIQERRFAYDEHGRLTGIDDLLRGARTFSLDALDRITDVRQDGTLAEHYRYDASDGLSGSRTPWSLHGARIEHAGNLRYEYDGQGRVIVRQLRLLSGGRKTWRYDWNAEDRLIAVTTPDGVVWRYGYDALGRRVAKSRLGDHGEMAESSVFTWDGPELAEVETAESATAWDWHPDSPRPLTQTRRLVRRDQEWFDAEFYSIISDLVGTPTELVDVHGDVAWRSTTSLWGAGTQGIGSVQSLLRFPGQYRDEETGLDYNLNRYYDAEIGAYLSPDPLGLDAGPNSRSYVSNPTTWLDPLGLTPCTDVERGPWTLTESKATDIKRGGPFNTKFYKSESDGTWWTPDKKGDGGSAFKVYRETSKGLEWVHDADKYGDYMTNKWKGPTGRFIPWSQLRG